MPQMYYASTNFVTKDQLQGAVANGKRPGLFKPGVTLPSKGIVNIEGPHFRQSPRRWYAKAQVEDGKIVAILN